MYLYQIAKLPYGKFRRELLMQYLVTTESPYNRIPINKSGVMNDNDPDLRYLIKKGILVRTRSNANYFKKSSQCRQTYLILS